MRNALVVGMAVLTFGCGPVADSARNTQHPVDPFKEDYTFTPDPKRKYPPVTDSNTPMVAELKARGLQQSGWDAEPFSCGPACDAVYVYALYLGQRNTWPKPNDHQFICPNPGRPPAQEAWRCAPYTSPDVHH